jgi:hypothetical protein
MNEITVEEKTQIRNTGQLFSAHRCLNCPPCLLPMQTQVRCDGKKDVCTPTTKQSDYKVINL